MTGIEILTLGGILGFGAGMFVWILVIGIILAEATLMVIEQWLAALGILVVVLAFSIYRFHLTTAIDSGTLIKFCLYYAAEGLVWMFIMWVWHSRRIKRKAETLCAEYKSRNRIIGRELSDSEINMALGGSLSLKNPPLARDNKVRLLNWAYLWPFSMVGTVTGDWLYTLLGRVLDQVAKIAWGGKLKV